MGILEMVGKAKETSDRETQEKQAWESFDAMRQRSKENKEKEITEAWKEFNTES